MKVFPAAILSLGLGLYRATTVRANDACIDATAATTLPFSTSDNMAGATSDFAVTTCSVPPTEVGRWYKFQGGDKIVEVSITASSINTRLTLFRGAGCATQICVTSKDDGGGNNNFLSFAPISGQTYRLLVTGVSASEGTYNIEIKELARPANDDCGSAIKLPTAPSSVGGNSRGSFSDFDATTCSVPPVSRGVWYNFTSAGSKIHELKVLSATFDNRLVVFTGTCGFLGCFAENDGAGSASSLSWQGTAGTEYIALVTGVDAYDKVGTFTLDLKALDRPDNDSCQTAKFVTGPGPAAFLDDTTGSFSDFTSTTCSVNPSTRGIWYSFVGNTGTVSIGITAATFDVNLVAFSGECGLQACVGNSDGSGNSASLVFPTVAGVKYNILVTGALSYTDVGTFQISISGDLAIVDPPTSAPTSPPTDGLPACDENIFLLLLQIIFGWISGPLFGFRFCV